MPVGTSDGSHGHQHAHMTTRLLNLLGAMALLHAPVVSAQCLPGEFDDTSGPGCTACPAGKYGVVSDAIGSDPAGIGCGDCSAGEYTASAGQTACERCFPCGVGEYLDGCTVTSAGTCTRNELNGASDVRGAS